jgi:hypothetical protein
MQAQRFKRLAALDNDLSDLRDVKTIDVDDEVETTREIEEVVSEEDNNLL